MNLRETVDGYIAANQKDWCGYVSMPLSYLRHFVYCPRSAFLSYSPLFSDNRYTVEGIESHSVVDDKKTRFNIRGKIHHSVYVWHDEMLIHGICDAVEDNGLVYLPVEHKRGKNPTEDSIMQAVGQAVCLSQMNNTVVLDEVVIYSSTTRKRHSIKIEDKLESFLSWHNRALHYFNNFNQNAEIPVSRSKCRGCSLIPICIPCSGVSFQND